MVFLIPNYSNINIININVNNNITDDGNVIADQIAVISETAALLRAEPNTWTASHAAVATTHTAAEDIPTSFSVSQSYPNPFDEQTRVAIALPEDAYVRVAVYNILGQQVRTLSEASMNQGMHHIRWDGTDDGGRRLGSGLYFFHIQTDQKLMTRQTVLIRK